MLLVIVAARALQLKIQTVRKQRGQLQSGLVRAVLIALNQSLPYGSRLCSG